MPITPDRLLHIDDDLLAVCKLSGELVVRGKGPLQRLPLFDFLRKEYPGLRVLHRLDFETSGVVLFARTKQAADSVLTSGFSGWRKTYIALVAGRVEGKGDVIRKKLPARSGGFVDAVTTYRVLKRFDDASLIEAEMTSGRHHQIRRHFAFINHPLLLDPQYGDARRNAAFTRKTRYRKFFLHASCVDLPHPVTGKNLRITAPLPKAFRQALTYLK
ncbi:hypothetical protein COU80_02805 [Candidatus Peregrinibacteria bacterium CG10_big_fil_rev_8_21_14_0_10_55_24]|nr:MAG: hypothetical protein COU80_02805 [Candidatus Peregrinibacteria bacterium CG10_big_fil_rev_8_21_14_0_10_55_24]